MEKSINGHNLFWFVIFATLSLFIVILCSFDYNSSNLTKFSLLNNQNPNSNHIKATNSCSNRYIYVYNLPQKFNDLILQNCTQLNRWYNMCPYIKNSGFGENFQLELGNNWFATNQFLLEVIFRNRISKYDCLTNDSSLASAIFIPYYGGLDIGRYLWDYNVSIRDSLGVDLVNWLVKKPEWKKMWGRDHFFVAGRIAWDFRRNPENDKGWGSKLMSLPESMNMTMLTIESTSWSNEFAIPYPTHFHPESEYELIQWQDRMRKQKRQYLFCFVGAPRVVLLDSIRDQIINQCLASNKKCKFLHCNSEPNICDNPVEVMKVFQDSVFCLQPPGDSYTRRSTFDSILAGCIPVFFHPGSAYVQYMWYLPKEYTKYSVFIAGNLVKNDSISINETLLQVSEKKIMSMREEVIKLIPNVIYANPNRRFKGESHYEDAFDIAIKGVLERVENLRREIKVGKDPAIGSAERNSWKQKLSGLWQEQDWDQYF